MPLRTDLALESVYTHKNEGIIQKEEKQEDCLVTSIEITTQEASRLVGKPMGNYVTVELENNLGNDDQLIESIAGVLAKELRTILPKEWGKILVVGLGN